MYSHRKLFCLTLFFTLYDILLPEVIHPFHIKFLGEKSYLQSAEGGVTTLRLDNCSSISEFQIHTDFTINL